MSWRQSVHAHRGVYCNLCGHSGLNHGRRMTVIASSKCSWADCDKDHETYGEPEYTTCGSCEKNNPTRADIYVHEFSGNIAGVTP